MTELIKNRYDFVLLFDVTDGNPNGDPDAGNLPRMDPETGMGLVTDVCLKRKIRNYVQIVKKAEKPFDIYIKEKAVLGRSHFEAFRELGIATGEGAKISIPDTILELFDEFSLPDGITMEEEDDKWFLNIASDMDKKLVKESLKESKPNKDLKKFIEDAIKNVKTKKPSGEETEKGREWMCKNFYDIRAFGAVLSLKTAPNCGQVRGPIQMTFGRSIDPVFALEHSITRMAVATEAEAEKQSGDNRTMGRKFTVPYGLYRTNGFISAHLAVQTGFNEDDLQLFWNALKTMFDHDHSAARGMMSTRRLIVFKHNTALGNTPAFQLFDLVNVEKKDKTKPARSFSDYIVHVKKDSLPSGVEMFEFI